MNIENAVQECDFVSIFEMCKISNPEKISGMLFKIGVMEENIAAYYSANFIAENFDNKNIMALFHHSASMILTNGFAHLKGAYSLGFYHFLKAIELDPDNLEYKKSILLTFADIPDFDMDIQLQRNIVDDILKIDPENGVALKFI